MIKCRQISDLIAEYFKDPSKEEAIMKARKRVRVRINKSLQGAAPNTERGKCSTDTTGKPNS